MTDEKKKVTRQSARESGEKFGKATSDAYNTLSTKTKEAYNASKDFIRLRIIERGRGIHTGHLP